MGGDSDNPFADDDADGKDPNAMGGDDDGANPFAGGNDADKDGDGDVDADDEDMDSDSPFGDKDADSDEDDAAGSPFAPADVSDDDADDMDDDDDDDAAPPKKSFPPKKDAKKDDKKDEDAAFLRSFLLQSVGDARRRNSSGLRMKEDALIMAQDPNAGFAPKPGEPGYAPQGIVGSPQNDDSDGFNEWLASYKPATPKARKKK
jgi:hypothetical protein